MDKYELVLDIIEHPENYTPERLTEIMSDRETREIYNILCKTDSAVAANKGVDVDAEWDEFARKHNVRRRRRFLWPGNRAASIAAITCTSIVAVAAGIAITVAINYNRPEPIPNDVTVTPTVESMSRNTVTMSDDTVRIAKEPVMFEDEPLETIMKEVAATYEVEVMLNNKETASLHLYYRLDPSQPINEVVEQLNTFERINIRQDGNTLIID